jgi:hypothetical protein
MWAAAIFGCLVIGLGLMIVLGALPVQSMSDNTLKTIMMFDVRGKYLLTESERKKAVWTAIGIPVGICIGIALGYLRSHLL